MLSVGIDLVAIRDIERAMENPLFLQRILGKEEYQQLALRGFPAQSVAVSFAAKEAFSKAMETGIRGFSLAEIELLKEENGRPFLKLSGKAKVLAEKKEICFSVSASHTKEYATVIVIGEIK